MVDESRLDVQFARLEATIQTELRIAVSDIKAIALRLESFVTRREWDDRKEYADDQFANHNDRLKKIEATQARILQGFAVGGAIVLGAAYAVFKGKVGLP